MPKPPTKPRASSAVKPDLKSAAKIARKPEAHTLIALQRTEDPHEHVRREFALTRSLDRFIDDELVPRFRRITGNQVNRSTVVRAILRALMERWLIEPPERPTNGLANGELLILEVIEQVLGMNQWPPPRPGEIATSHTTHGESCDPRDS